MVVHYRSGRQRFTLLLLVLMSITVITIDSRGGDKGAFATARSVAQDVVAPVQSVVAGVFSPIGNVFDRLTGGSVEKENERLRRDLAAARGKLLRANQMESEARRLNELLGLSFAPDVKGIAARVIGYGPGNFESTILLDKGSSAQLAVGMPVITPEGLVGRVIKVSSHRAVVLLLTDATSGVGVRFTSTGDRGIAQGTGRPDSLDLDLVDPKVAIQRGEIVVTAGLQNGRFPAGIPVARVTRVRKVPGALEQDIKIQPIVQTGSLEHVKVLIWLEEKVSSQEAGQLKKTGPG